MGDGMKGEGMAVYDDLLAWSSERPAWHATHSAAWSSVAS